MSRRSQLAELGVLELADRVIVLERENAALRRAIAGAFCGDVMGSVSCQLARGHDGELHAWADPTSDLIVRWA